MSDLKLCINCVHMVPKRPTYAERCAAPNNQYTDPVTGQLELEIEYCSHQRSGKFSGTCGEEGKWYLGKTKTNPKPFWLFRWF